MLRGSLKLETRVNGPNNHNWDLIFYSPKTLKYWIYKFYLYIFCIWFILTQYKTNSHLNSQGVINQSIMCEQVRWLNQNLIRSELKCQSTDEEKNNLKLSSFLTAKFWNEFPTFYSSSFIFGQLLSLFCLTQNTSCGIQFFCNN